ncbi:MAG: hypothetical protein JO281_17055 [Pseudonocardiales bacterium]|nr:hypothetical protein [Pseudonocardiales bacterium]
MANETNTVGLALGGIGGFNAHDAGVLKAAYDLGVRPDVISCTSGAIFWTYLFLTNPEEIPAEVQRQADAVHGVNALWVAAFGYPKIFAPATRQYWARWMTPWNPFSVNEFLDRLLPAQVYEPTRTTADFEGIAQAFNDSKTPVIFNAYVIAEGRELLFVNEAASDFLDDIKKDLQRIFAPLPFGPDLPDGEAVEALPWRGIDAEAVKTALWLVLYGFGHKYEDKVTIDGAYRRQVILSELTKCERVYVVKPQPTAWAGVPPANYFDVQDFNTEMWFNSSYASERAALKYADEQRNDPTKVVEITMDRPLGFFNYFVERMKTYKDGYDQAKELFGKNLTSMTKY